MNGSVAAKQNDDDVTTTTTTGLNRGSVHAPSTVATVIDEVDSSAGFYDRSSINASGLDETSDIYAEDADLVKQD